MNAPPGPDTATVGAVDNGSTAVLVTIASDGRLLDRRTIDLVDPGMSTHPHHHEGSWAMGRYLSTPGARRLPIADAVALVDRVSACAVRRARLAFETLADAVPTAIGCLAIRAWPAVPSTVEARISDARVQTFADSVMYREVLAEVARGRGWRVVSYDADHVRDAAAAMVPAGDGVDTYLAALGKAAGPPWRAAHKLAALAALAAHASVPPPRSARPPA